MFKNSKFVFSGMNDPIVPHSSYVVGDASAPFHVGTIISAIPPEEEWSICWKEDITDTTAALTEIGKLKECFFELFIIFEGKSFF